MNRKLFAERLGRIMTALNLQQNELAARIGRSPSAVTFWLSGETVPQPGTLRKLAAALGTTPDYLSGKSDNPWPAPAEGATEEIVCREEAVRAMELAAQRLRDEAHALDKRAATLRGRAAAVSSARVAVAAAGIVAESIDGIERGRESSGHRVQGGRPGVRIPEGKGAPNAGEVHRKGHDNK